MTWTAWRHHLAGPARSRGDLLRCAPSADQTLIDVPPLCHYNFEVRPYNFKLQPLGLYTHFL